MGIENYVVAVGASAGGLDPCERYFDKAPVDQGFTYVVIQHLSPDFRSLMDELLARHSSMPIHRVEDGMPIEPNTIFLNRPRQNLTVANGRFVVREEENEDVIHQPIDSFFESISDQYGEKAIGVVLSGSGSDGSRGAREIKSRGGRVFAQAVDTAKFDSMPRSILTAKLADGVAPPEDLPALIMRQIGGEELPIKSELRPSTDDPVQDIFALMQERFGTDFSLYKSETIERRLNRRKDLSGFSDMKSFFQAIQNDRSQLDALYNDMLIEVTSFFRDKEAFDDVERHVIPKICANMSKKNPVRIWVPGCASGEEAYSLMMLVAEYARNNNLTFNLKILATDIHQRSLSAASAGIYTKEHMSVLSDSLKERYFEEVGGYYQVRPQWRRSVVFSPHDLLSDPPFTRIDLVSCRNVMIYLTEEAQQKLLSLFHFSLRHEAFLFLGPSETTGRLAREFTQVSQRWRIFQKARDVRLADTTRLLSMPRAPKHLQPSPIHEARLPKAAATKQSADYSAIFAAMDKLVGLYAPPGFMLDNKGNLVHIFGDARKYVEFSSGAFRNRLDDLIVPDLRPHVKSMLDRVRHGILVEHSREAKTKNAEGKEVAVRLTISALADEQIPEDTHVLFGIEELNQEISPVKSSGANDELVTTYAARVSELESALAGTEENLQAIIEEMETSNEELQATNEELMSANEELQSTNEELHSVNEELYTVSAEHERKIDELSELTTDMDHLLKSTGIGTIFLDSELSIRRFTPAASQTFNVIAQDNGRPFSHITARFDEIDVLEVVTRVRDSGQSEDHQVTANGRCFLLRALPYVVMEVEEDPGVVVTVIDIDELQQARSKIADMAQMQEEVISDIGQYLVRWNKTDRVVTYCNESFADAIEKAPEDVFGARIKSCLPASALNRIQEAAREIEPGAYKNVVIRIDGVNGPPRIWDAMVRAIPNRAGKVVGYQMTAKDLTHERAYIQALEEVLAVDRQNKPDVKGNAALQGVELARVEKLLEIVQAYLGADKLLVTIGPAQEEAMPLDLPAVSMPGVVPERAYEVLHKLVPDQLSKAETIGYSTSGTRGRTRARTLIDELEASRVLVGPIVARNRVIGRVAMSVSDDEDRNFSELELALARIVIRWVGYIWERGRAVEEARRTASELRLIFDSVPDRIWYKDDKNRILRLNAAAAASMGTTVEAATGADTYELFPKMAAKYHEDDLKVIRSGKPMRDILERYTPRDGKEGWVKTSKIPFNDEAGNRNLLVVASDVSELKARESDLEKLNSALSLQQEIYKEIYRHTPTMMLTTDKTGKIKDVNDLLTSTGGYEPKDLVGKPMADFFVQPKTDVLKAMGIDFETLAEREARSFLCKNGKPLEVELSGIDDQPADGDFRRLWVVQDVTERNAALAALKDKNTELEQLNDGLAQFAYAASHDLQEPLRKIRQYGDLLWEDFGKRLDDDGQFYVNVMTSSAERMSELVKNLLMFSSASQVDLTPKRVKLGTLLKKTLEEHKHLVETVGADVKIGSLPTVKCDADLVEIVFSNLLSNAIKYRNRDKKLKIEIGMIQDKAKSPNFVTVRFKDNGVGFEKSEAGRIFDPFVRLVAKSEIKGSGIGLAICRTICERHGWSLTASSSKGRHATFNIRIPLKG